MTNRSSFVRILPFLTLPLFGATTGDTGPPDTEPGIALSRIAKGYRKATAMAFVPGTPKLLVVAQKAGSLDWIDLSTGAEGGWLRIPVVTRLDQGLLGLTFHPDFATNGLFYLHYSVENDDGRWARITEWGMDPDGDVRWTRPSQRRVLLEVPQPYANHNGGDLQFGPDGLLYGVFGDGGATGDPDRQAQDPRSLLGTVIRIDVDRQEDGRPYGVPRDNPFYDLSPFRPEIFAWGVRDPHHMAFLADGRLLIPDRGEQRWEEVSLVAGGENLGWRTREASHCYAPARRCADEGMTDPVLEYDHWLGTGIVGGEIYQGSSIPWLRGHYVYGDATGGWIHALPVPDSATERPVPTEIGRFHRSFSAFTKDAWGEMYVADGLTGELFRLADRL